MLNKPKYNIQSNTKYAINGFIALFKHEKSFKLDILFFIVFSIVALFITNLDYKDKIKMILSLLTPIFAESINSAIERCVDLITKDKNELAKQAKDIGAFIVFLSYIYTIVYWSTFFI